MTMPPARWIAPLVAGVATVIALLLQARAATAPLLPPLQMCQTNGRVWDIAYYNSTWYLAGDFTQVRPSGVPLSGTGSLARTGLAACNLSGTPLTWNPVVTHTTPANFTIQTLAVLTSTNTIYFGGRFTHVNGLARQNAAAVGAFSGNARDFAPGLGVNTKVNDIVLSSDGATAYLGGWFGAQAWSTSGAGAKLNAFAPVIRKSNNSSTGIVTALALTPDQQTLYLGGSDFYFVNGQPRLGAAAIDAATGASTLAFAPVISDTKEGDLYPQIYDVRLSSSHVYLCGDWWTTEGIGEQDPNGRQRNLGRFDPTSGAADLNWLPWTDGGVQGCDLDLRNNVLIIGGHFDKTNGFTQTVTDTLPTNDLAAIDLTTGSVLPWQPGTSGGGSQLWAVTAAGEIDQLAVGGEFDVIAGVTQSNAGRFALATPTTTPTQPSPTQTVPPSSTPVASPTAPTATAQPTPNPNLTPRAYLPVIVRDAVQP